MIERPRGTSHINASANPDGSRNVSFYSPAKGWSPAGRLMPQFSDSRQQPKSLAFKLLAARTRIDFVVGNDGVAVDVR